MENKTLKILCKHGFTTEQSIEGAIIANLMVSHKLIEETGDFLPSFCANFISGGKFCQIYKHTIDPTETISDEEQFEQVKALANSFGPKAYLSVSKVVIAEKAYLAIYVETSSTFKTGLAEIRDTGDGKAKLGELQWHMNKCFVEWNGIINQTVTV